MFDSKEMKLILMAVVFASANSDDVAEALSDSPLIAEGLIPSCIDTNKDFQELAKKIICKLTIC
jgi:hypothetical protein